MKAIDKSFGAHHALCSVLVVMVILGAQWAGSVSLAQANQQYYAGQELARSFIDAAYRVSGPLNVVEMTGDTLTLRNPYKDMVLSLRGQQLAVMDANARPLSTSEIVTGSTVYVCCKGQQTAVIVLPK